MFTGIIEQCGTIESIQAQGAGSTVCIKTTFDAVTLGESIAVNGICLTVTDFQGHDIFFDISPETLSKTTAGTFNIGDQVNLERALRVGDRVGGHFVLGHVDQRAKIMDRVSVENFEILRIGSVQEGSRALLLTKGCVAIDGVSLTINKLTTDGFQVMLVPHTAEKTQLLQKQPGEWVNLEFDMLARTIARQHDLLTGEQ